MSFVVCTATTTALLITYYVWLPMYTYSNTQWLKKGSIITTYSFSLLSWSWVYSNTSSCTGLISSSLSSSSASMVAVNLTLVSSSVSKRLCVCVHAHVHVCICACVCVYLCVCMFVCMCVYMHWVHMSLPVCMYSIIVNRSAHIHLSVWYF